MAAGVEDPMDYGDRQDRALDLIQLFKKHSNQTGPIFRDHKGQSYRAGEIVSHIAEQTPLGQSIVAIAGLVAFARPVSQAKFKVACEREAEGDACIRRWK